MGCIGVGSMGSGNMRAFLGDQRVQVVAVCDVDANHRQRARQQCQLPKSAAFNDFRQITERKDIDAVMIATPDYWHAIIAIAAARAGKDMYCEKPLALTIVEGHTVSDVVQRYGRLFQTGTWRRSISTTRFACELVQNGRLGKVHTIRVGVPGGVWLQRAPALTYPMGPWSQVPEGSWKPFKSFDYLQLPMPVPESLDYEMWLGPAPYAPYTAGRCHLNWRWILDYGGGFITDWGAHMVDVAQWGNGTDRTGPVEVEGHGEWDTEGLYNVPLRFSIVYTYANSVKMIYSTTEDGNKWGVRFEGTDGWLFIDQKRLDTYPQSLAKSVIGPNEIHLYNSYEHHGNFIDCVRSRAQTATPVEVAHRTTSVCHLGAIAVQLQRKLKWDPDAERFVNDDEANRMLVRPMRSPWHL